MSSSKSVSQDIVPAVLQAKWDTQWHKGKHFQHCFLFISIPFLSMCWVWPLSLHWNACIPAEVEHFVKLPIHYWLHMSPFCRDEQLATPDLFYPFPPLGKAPASLSPALNHHTVQIHRHRARENWGKGKQKLREKWRKNKKKEETAKRRKLLAGYSCLFSVSFLFIYSISI